MKVVSEVDHFEKPRFAAVTIGTFDGVHIGHQEILSQLIKEAKDHDGKSILITFWPHPRFVLNKDSSSLKLLSTFGEKLELLKHLGLDYVIKIPFTPEFSNLSAKEFVKNILVDRIGTKKLLIGYNHHFGNNREGNIDFLNEQASRYGYSVQEIPRQDIDDIGISATKIRNYLHDGQVQLANALLGRSYGIKGKVVHGDKIGRKIGFPTANIEIEEEYKLLPGDGAYAIQARVKGRSCSGMLNIGFKPTVNGERRTIEAHLFNFDGDIYDQEIRIDFTKSLRKEMKFSSIEELKQQLDLDKKNALIILS